MKILVFSDSHGLYGPMERAVVAETPDLVLHLGDGQRDFQKLREAFPAIPMEFVPGNCDYFAEGPLTLVLTPQNTRIMMTHGHRYGVKSGILRAVYAAREQEADILLFGHTHKPLCLREEALWIMNPGSAREGRYGVITLEQGEIECRLCGQC